MFCAKVISASFWLLIPPPTDRKNHPNDMENPQVNRFVRRHCCCLKLCVCVCVRFRSDKIFLWFYKNLENLFFATIFQVAPAFSCPSYTIGHYNVHQLCVFKRVENCYLDRRSEWTASRWIVKRNFCFSLAFCSSAESRNFSPLRALNWTVLISFLCWRGWKN